MQISLYFIREEWQIFLKYFEKLFFFHIHPCNLNQFKKPIIIW